MQRTRRVFGVCRVMKWKLTGWSWQLVNSMTDDSTSSWSLLDKVSEASVMACLSMNKLRPISRAVYVRRHCRHRGSMIMV